MEVLRPESAGGLREIVAEAAASRTPIEIAGGGSKRAIGAPTMANRIVDVRSLNGIIDHDPAELVITVAAGTPLRDVEAALEREQQMLAFEPFDHGPLFGRPAGNSTIGGVIAANVSGSRRISAGAARDHLLGFSAVSGHGELFRAGGAVVKNVTGFDLPKLMAGSWGTLAVLTEVTLRLLPRPRDGATLRIQGLSPRKATEAMAAALGSSAAVSGAVHTPAGTLLRLEGFGPSVMTRFEILARLLERFGPVDRLDSRSSQRRWAEIASLADLPVDGHALWRISAPPVSGGRIAEAISSVAVGWQLDWGGGLLWVAVPDEGDAAAKAIHAAAAAHQANARLIRANESVRIAARCLQPSPPPALTAIAARIKRAFDPNDILNRGHPGPEA
jgi:glycolate oxidase FAD binding subunit